MRAHFCLWMAAPLLMSILAFGQAGQSSAQQTPAAQPPQATQQLPAQAPASPKSPPHETNDKCPCKPWTVVDAANASKQSKQDDPTAKVYKNKDVKDPTEADATSAASPAAANSQATASAPKSQPARAAPQDSSIQSPEAFKVQGDVFKNQILLEKQKLAAIQNRITDLKYQFDTWASSFAQDGGAQSCWTTAYSQYKDWCDTGKNLKAQYDAAQGQLKQEKATLEKMQEAIRRKGYGNAVYDPD